MIRRVGGVRILKEGEFLVGPKVLANPETLIIQKVLANPETHIIHGTGYIYPHACLFLQVNKLIVWERIPPGNQHGLSEANP